MTHMVTVDRVLDARALPAAAATAAALSRFDALSPGEKFVLVATAGGLELLKRLQAERAGLFEWSLLESGPSVWRIEIARREAPAGAKRDILEALAWDHDRLDALEDAAFRARAFGDLQSAFDLYEEFSVGLRRHIGFEEDLLFPAFEAASGMPPTAGPTAVMRAEHREIQDLLDRIASGMGDAAADVDGLRSRFHAVLGDHNLKEEQVLYPGTDDLLGPEKADRLVRQIQGYGIGAGLG
jgi:regulator of cell morphogenesis and NO signaling